MARLGPHAGRPRSWKDHGQDQVPRGPPRRPRRRRWSATRPSSVIGEGIGERGGSYKVTEGLLAQFGPGRVIDTPLSEAGFVGLGVGAAIAGQRPVVEMLFIDFLLLAMDQVVNQAAKYRFMSGGEGRVPLVIRTQGGAGNSLAGQHSQSLEALFYHVPGLKVVMPVDARTTPRACSSRPSATTTRSSSSSTSCCT